MLILNAEKIKKQSYFDGGRTKGGEEFVYDEAVAWVVSDMTHSYLFVT